MKHATTPTEAGKRYAAAYEAHYTAKDLHQALNRYRDIMTGHPDTQEAGYSRMQIRNIAKDVVPKQDLLGVQIELTLSLLKTKMEKEKALKSS